METKVAVVLLEVARLSFGLGILASKLKGMAENLSPEAKKFLLSANEYDPSVPATATLAKAASGCMLDWVTQSRWIRCPYCGLVVSDCATIL